MYSIILSVMYVHIFVVCFQSVRSFPEGEFRNYCPVQSESKAVSWSIRRVCSAAGELDGAFVWPSTTSLSHFNNVECYPSAFCTFYIFVASSFLYSIPIDHSSPHSFHCFMNSCDHHFSLCPYYYNILFLTPVHSISLYAICISNYLILN